MLYSGPAASNIGGAVGQLYPWEFQPYQPSNTVFGSGFGDTQAFVNHQASQAQNNASSLDSIISELSAALPTLAMVAKAVAWLVTLSQKKQGRIPIPRTQVAQPMGRE